MTNNQFLKPTDKTILKEENLRFSYIGFTLLYFKMAVMPLVPDTKMADFGKLICLGYILVRKVTWLVLTTTSANLILFVPRIWSRLHDKDCLYILPSSKHSFSFTFWLTETALSLSPLRLTETTHSLHFDLQKQLSLSISTHWDNTLSYIWLLAVNPTKMYTFCNPFLSSSAFSVGLFPASNTSSEISTNPERDKQPTWEKTRSS